MARAEELSKAADKYTADKEHYVERCRWIDGAEWADKTMIDKACEWIKENSEMYIVCEDRFYSGWLNEDFYKEFRKAMES